MLGWSKNGDDEPTAYKKDNNNKTLGDYEKKGSS